MEVDCQKLDKRLQRLSCRGRAERERSMLDKQGRLQSISAAKARQQFECSQLHETSQNVFVLYPDSCCPVEHILCKQDTSYEFPTF